MADEERKNRSAGRFGETTPLEGVGQCQGCAHRRAWAKCAAFPNGIPWGIQYNHISHKEPYPGDHGIQFEQR